jgi:hypothetical protein
VLVGQSADGNSEESITIANPVAATCVAEIDGYSVPAGSTTYNYVNIFANPSLGRLRSPMRTLYVRAVARGPQAAP